MEISQKILREAVRYEPETGQFFWLQERPLSHFKSTQASATWHTKFAGKQAGTQSTNHAGKTYRYLHLFGRVILAHRMAFLYVTGRHPSTIDHIDGDGTNNKWRNLREVKGASENNKNQRLRSDNTSGYVGVIWFKPAQKWKARITVDGKHKSLGYFESIDDAVNARLAAERKQGYSNNHGEKRPL